MRGVIHIDILKIFLTSLLSIVVIFAICKILGHKQVAQLDFFDYITGITLGSIAAELATELEHPVLPLIAMIIYGVVALTLSIVTSKHPRARKFINGTPTVIMSDGKIYRENMKKAKLDLSEFLLMCRQEGYFNPNDIHTAVYEYNGRLTILPHSAKRPAMPCDFDLNVSEEGVATEVIMDGVVLEENLARLGLNAAWLDKELEKQHYKSAEDIMLGVCDECRNLSLFEAK